MKIPVVQRIMSANDQIAAENQAQFDAAGVFVLNVMASPGAGKTSPGIPFFLISCRAGEGMEEWAQWLMQQTAWK